MPKYTIIKRKNKCSSSQWSNRISTEKTAVEDLQRVQFCLGNEFSFHNMLAFPQSDGWKKRMKATAGEALDV